MVRDERIGVSCFRAAAIGLLGVTLALPLQSADEPGGKTFAAPEFLAGR